MIPTLSQIYAYQLRFPKPGSFCTTALSVWVVKLVFGFGFGSHIIAFTANGRGGGDKQQHY